MTDNEKKPDSGTDEDWSAGAKVGAAVGSAALVAALLYAGKRSLSRKASRLEPLSPEPEIEPMTENTPKSETD